MKMDEHARAWAHELVGGILTSTALPPEQRNSLHWEIVNHLYEAAERRVEAHGGTQITLADMQAVVNDMGGSVGIAAAFLQTRVAATPRAGFGKRFGAFVVDAFLAAILVGFVFGGFFGIISWWDLDQWGPFDIDFEPFFFFGLAYAYFVLTEIKYGATIGKMAFKLRTVMVDGRPLTTEAALVRNIAKAVPPLLLLDGLLYVFAFKNEDQRASDRLANTVVIDTSRAVWSAPPAGSSPPPTVNSAGGPPDPPALATAGSETPPPR